MGVQCKICGVEKKPWHADAADTCVNCSNLDFKAEHQFYIGITILFGVMVVGSLISIYTLTEYW